VPGEVDERVEARAQAIERFAPLIAARMRDQRSRKGRYELLIYRGSAGGSGELATGGGPVHVDAAQRMLVRFVGTLASSARGRYDNRRLEFYERGALSLGSAARADPQAHGHQPTKVLAQTPPTTGYDPVVACLTARAISGTQAKVRTM